MNNRYKVDISQMFTDMELQKETENNKGGNPTTLEEEIDVISSKPGCKALIEGEGGIGKTTILRHLSYMWATPNQSNNIFEGKIVFFLCLRDLEKDADIYDLIVKQLDMTDFNLETDLPEDPRLIKKCIKILEDKIVLLLDGLDELRFNNQSVISLFRKDNFKKSTVILTSRSENIDEFKRECNVHVRVKGFNQERIWEYIDKYFKYFREPQLGESLKRELYNQTNYFPKHPEAYSMCKNPMSLLSICMLWENDQSLPSDSSDLFKQLFRSILNQFNKQKQFAKISKFEDTPAKYVYAMVLLGKCMYKSLKQNQLSINRKDLNNTHSNKDLVDMAVKLGFVYEEAPILKSNFESVFMPPHKLIVESLVGLYLSKLCESEGLKFECEDDVRRLLTPFDDNTWGECKLCESKGMKCGCNTDIKRLLAPLDDKEWEVIRENVQCDGHFIRLIMQLYCMEDFDEKIERFSSGRMAGECKGKVIAHILAIAECDERTIIKNLIGDSDAFKHFVTECSLKQVQLALTYLNIPGNNFHNIDVNLMCSLLIMSPKLRALWMPDCNLSGDVINHLGTECSHKQIQLPLDILDISGNNLHNIDVNSLSSFLIMCPKLRELYMRDCNLSVDVINHLSTECSHKQVQLPLDILDISGNNLHNIDVNSLSSFLIMCPKLLRELYMRDCNLSVDVINHLSTDCSHKQVQLPLDILDISRNNLHNIVNSLSSLLIMCPKLRELYMRDCNLSGDVINYLTEECLKRRILFYYK
ncbi:NACHT, LRR and PYD domains-containing protein 4C-like [Antedon mediterranea]|uniref:NACHT, LRR and PYD domains-containing protein 4C-like n=1 Tax=Antedon mediterranea TaxID=105859 RepID=UPI003AF96E50